MRSLPWVLCICLFLSACGGGGGSTSSSGTPATPSTPSGPLTNFTTITVDDGPPALNIGAGAYVADDTPYVTVTLCAPGTSNCQTIDHVILDTGSVGLRVIASVVNSSLRSAMPTETDANANPVGECYGYVEGYAFGSVRSADFQIGGASVSGMPVQVIGDTGAFSSVPSTCSAGGGQDLNTVQAFGGNAILGVGVTTTDCGASCTLSGGYAAAIYYDCPSGGCSSIIARAASTVAPFQQVVNPIAAMSTDNNGSIISMPVAPTSGEASMTGTFYFGIGTESNNGLGSATVITTTNSRSPNGSGLISVLYNGKNLNESFIDSGSNAYYFVNSSIPICPTSGYTGFYCPISTQFLSLTINGQNGASVAESLPLNNAVAILSNNYAVAPGIGVNPNLISALSAFPSSFDIGFPFFYGRNLYTAIEGRAAGSSSGPYFAF